MPAIQRLNTAQPDFWSRLQTLTAWEGVADEAVTATVREILAQVRARGDEALLEFTQRFDRTAAVRAADLEISAARLQRALADIPRRWKSPPPGFALMRNDRNRTPGASPNPTAPRSANRSQRWIGSACTSQAARRPIRPRC